MNEADHSAWRIVRDASGEIVGTKRFDVPQKRVPRVHGELHWHGEPGMEWVPWCPFCSAPMRWVGVWQCAGCTQRGGWELRLDGGRWECPSRLPREALAGAPIFSSPEGTNSTGHWLETVEHLTSFHRRSVAAKLRVRGTRPAQEYVDNDGVVTHGDPYVSVWHQRRVVGQGERFQRVRECGAYEYALDVTGHDGKVTTRPLEKRCDCWRVCRRCLNRRKWKLSNGMTSSRARALSTFSRESRKGYRGTEGKWSEKLITFTVPHGQSPADDARVIVGAWQKLLRKVRQHLAERGATARSPSGRVVPVSVPWCRALEVAPGATGGHAHLHVWWFGPFVDVVLLRVWWGSILADGGRESPHRTWGDVRRQGRDSRLSAWLGVESDDAIIPWPVVDVRAGGDASAMYTQKVGIALYTTKGSDLMRLSPVHAASIYEVFEGTRAVQWARGWAPKKQVLVAKCVSFRRLTEQEKKELNSRFVTMRSDSCEAGKSCAQGAENPTGGRQSSNGTAAPDTPHRLWDASGAGRGPSLTGKHAQLSMQLDWTPNN